MCLADRHEVLVLDRAHVSSLLSGGLKRVGDAIYLKNPLVALDSGQCAARTLLNASTVSELRQLTAVGYMVILIVSINMG